MTAGSLEITGVAFTSAPARDAGTGLLGWVVCVLNETLMVDGIALRRTRDGRLTLSFPARRDSTGRQHAYVRPLDDQARRDLEQQIFARLGIEKETEA